MTYEEIARVLENECDIRGLTTWDLHKETGIGYATLRKAVWYGQPPTTTTLMLICEHLGFEVVIREKRCKFDNKTAIK